MSGFDPHDPDVVALMDRKARAQADALELHRDDDGSFHVGGGLRTATNLDAATLSFGWISGVMDNIAAVFVDFADAVADVVHQASSWVSDWTLTTVWFPPRAEFHGQHFIDAKGRVHKVHGRKGNLRWKRVRTKQWRR